MPYEILDVVQHYAGWSRFRTAEVRRPDGGTMQREIEDHGDAAAILPFDPVRRLAILVGQFRAAVAFARGPAELLEAPAGLLDGEEPAICARREALEEVGLALRHVEPVGRIWGSPGISTEFMHLFLAEYAPSDRVAAGGGLASENEDVRVVELPLHELAAHADQGEVIDLKTFALIQTLRLRRPELFV